MGDGDGDGDVGAWGRLEGSEQERLSRAAKPLPRLTTPAASSPPPGTAHAHTPSTATMPQTAQDPRKP